MKRKIRPMAKRMPLDASQMMQSQELMHRVIPANTVIPVEPPTLPTEAKNEKEGSIGSLHRLRGLHQHESDNGGKKTKVNNVEKMEFDSWDSTPLLSSVKQALEKQHFHRSIGPPTSIQQKAIHALLKHKDALIASETGSGKTLAYLLPLIHRLKLEEMQSKESANATADGDTAGTDTTSSTARTNHRPRMIVVVPTKELASQVQYFVKQLCHQVKLRSILLRSDVPLRQLKKALQTPVDIVVTTPQTLIDFHTDPRMATGKKADSNERLIYFSECRYLVLDEADTLLGKGFREDVADKIVMPIKQRHLKSPAHKTQFVFVLATYHKQVDQFLKKEFPQVERITTKDMHHKISNVRHRFVECGTDDKLQMLVKVLRRETSSRKVLVFTNTVKSARAVDYCLNDNGFKVASFHSEIPAKKQNEFFESFRNGDVPVLVCTDIASRGLDIPDVDHVVMFDFPLNVIDYIHRAGRTGRMNTKGKVTSLIRKRDKTLADAIDLAIAKRLPMEMITGDKQHNTDFVPQLTRRTKTKGKSSKAFGSSSSTTRVMNSRRLSSSVALKRLRRKRNLKSRFNNRKSSSAPSFFDV